MRSNPVKTSNIPSPYAYVGFACNNNCIFCSEADEYLEALHHKTLAEVKRALRQIRKHYDFVSIMGREPTVRKDILEILAYARALKFRQVGMTTNGRMLSVPSFCEAVLQTGVNQIGISLSGASARVHDAQTRVPGSFTQTVQGIKNIMALKRKNVSVLVNLPLNRQNYCELPKALTLLKKIGVREINILNIAPLSRRSRSKRIIMPMRTLGAYVCKVLRRSGLLKGTAMKVLLVEFPPCCLPVYARKYFFPCLEKNNRKVRIRLCGSCPHVHQCDGILDSYLALYGSREFTLSA